MAHKFGRVTFIMPMIVLVAVFFIYGRTSAHLSNPLFSHLTGEQQECVEKALGEDVYRGLSDWAQVTNEMKVSMGSCFGETVSHPAPTGGTPPSGATTSPPTTITPPTTTTTTNPFASMREEDKKCMVEVLGEVRFKELEAGAAFSEADKNTMSTSGCFGKQTTVGDTKIVPVKTNPFEGMHDSMNECVKTALGTRYEELKNGGGFTDADQAAVEKAHCFKDEGKYERGERPEGANPEVEECVKGILGEERKDELRSSGTPPTPGEMEKMEECFTKDKKYQPNPVHSREGVSTEVDKCMRLALGDRFEDIKRGLAPITEDDRTAGYKCMGKANDPIAPPPKSEMPDSLQKCLVEAVGEERFNAIKGGEEPTEAEKSKGEECFSSHEKKAKPKTIKSDQILPPPPEEVPFIKTDAKAVKIDSVQIVDDKLTITGEATQGTANVVVDVYVYSEDPIQTTAKTNKDGSWTLVYDGTVTKGAHTSFAVVKQSGENVRSDAKAFDTETAQAQEIVPAPAAEPTTTATAPTVEPEQKNQFLAYRMYLAVTFIGLGLIGIIVYIVTKIRKRSSPPTTVVIQGESAQTGQGERKETGE